MDLLATVRKEGARGGRGDFKWSDVQSSTHRENYLGHSLMAPVGRWQKGRDLNWYAKGDGEDVEGEDPAQKAERERKEEIRLIKEAEQDALAKALGFEVQPRNPNMEALGDKKEVDRILKEAAEENAEDQDGDKGVGFGTFGGRIGPKKEDVDERIEGTAFERVPQHVSGRDKKSEEAEAGAETEHEMPIGYGEDVSTVMGTEGGGRGRARDIGSDTRGLDREIVIGDLGQKQTMRAETMVENEVARRTTAKQTDEIGTKTDTIGMNEDAEDRARGSPSSAFTNSSFLDTWFKIEAILS